MERITSRQNPLAAHIRKLNTSRAYRREQGEFVCEGPKLLTEALRWNAEVLAVVTAEGVRMDAPGSARRVEVPASLFAALSSTETPQGGLFLCRLPELMPPDKLSGKRYLVLDGVQDPGNLGTVWRTADAFGADGLFLVNGCADPFAPKTVRGSMGACFRLPVWEAGLERVGTLLAGVGVPLYATALRADTVDVRKADLTCAAVVIGSEGRGVSAQALEACEKTLRIPMRERCESLNAAVAASVVLWEMRRGE